MSGTLPRHAPGALLASLAFLVLFALARDAAAATYAGRPIADVLAELRGPGLDFIYSSELLPRSLTVATEPTSTNRLVIARDILAARGLALTVVRPGLFAVTARDDGKGRRVHGRVLDAAGRPVPNAAVRLTPIQALDWTNAEGQFSIGPVPEGTYTLTAEAGGYAVAEIRGFVVADGGPEAELRLQPDTSELAEVVVATSRYALDRFGGSGAVSLSGDMLAAQAGTGDDALRALGRLPGMAQGGLSAQSNIRGSEAGELLTLVDDFPVRETFHLPAYHDVFGMLDPTLLADAEVYTGGFPVRYGNRMGGVFDLHTVASSAEPHSALGLSVFNAMARNSGALDRYGLDWLALARIGTLKPFVQAFARQAGSPSYSDVYARVGWGDAERLRLTANFLWSRDEFAITRRAEGEHADLESRSSYLWLRGDHDFGSGVEATLLVGTSGIQGLREGSIDNPGISTGRVDDWRSSDYWDVRGRVAWQVNPRHWLEGGFEWVGEQATYRYASEAAFSDDVAGFFSREPGFERTADLEPRRQRSALYADYRWQVVEPLVAEFGLRAQRTLTDKLTSEDWLLDPRVNVRWQLGPSTSARAHWGRFHQADEVHELKVEDGLTQFPEAQRSDQVIVGVDHRLNNGLALRLEWYRKLQSDPRPRFENLLDPMSLIPEIAPDRVEVAPLAASVRGAEISAASEGRELNWWVGLAWSEARDSLGGRTELRSWDQSWAVTAGADWILGNWRLGAVAASHRGWPMTPVTDGVLGRRNSERFPVRATLDLRAEYRRPLAVGSLAVTFEVANAINEGNTCCQQLVPEDDGTGGTTFTTKDSDWLPVVPSIGILWEF